MIAKRTILGQQILYLMAGHETETFFLAQADGYRMNNSDNAIRRARP